MKIRALTLVLLLTLALSVGQAAPTQELVIDNFISGQATRRELVNGRAIIRRSSDPANIAGGYLARFADDYCGTDFRLKYPFPGPRPHWFAEELGGFDLVVMASSKLSAGPSIAPTHYARKRNGDTFCRVWATPQ